MASYSFLRRPRWIAGIVVALIGIVVFVNFGFWQLRRLDERRTINAQIAARSDLPPVDVGALDFDAEDLEYRIVDATGVYLVADEVILLARSLGGLSGHHVLTPLEYAPGRAVLVERGWVPIDVEGPPAVGFEPVRADVVVRGVVLDEPSTGPLGASIPQEGELARIPRIDIERLQDQIDAELAPFYLRLVDQEPAQEVPRRVPPPEIDEGPHLSYAVQWFIFAGVVVVGFPVLVTRTAKRGAGRSRMRPPV